MRGSSSHPSLLQESAGETGFPGHYIGFLILCRQLNLSVFTHMTLFCLKRLLRASLSCRQSPSLWVLSCTYKAKRETLSCPGREHKHCLCISCCIMVQELQAFVPINLVCYNLAWSKTSPCKIFSFPLREKLVKLQENVNLGGFEMRLLDSRVPGAIHGFLQQRSYHEILKAPVTGELTLNRYTVIASPGVLKSLLPGDSQVLW